MYAELAQYVAPKRRAIDHSAADGAGEFTFKWMSADGLRELPTTDLVDRVLQDIAAGEVPADDVPRLMDSLRARIGARVS